MKLDTKGLRRRIARKPDFYQQHIYGEYEAGGTSWLYLSSVPFEQLGFETEIGHEPILEWCYRVSRHCTDGIDNLAGSLCRFSPSGGEKGQRACREKSDRDNLW
jgi:hypothetical protein